ncbi:MAG: serine/threonine-protein phosphatase [Bifidobacteriaceae bacterium]|jgi:protein phosphatase|nr:serine/threonine-protein phosphatase [Bifidobacteriaceae bacterium]
MRESQQDAFALSRLPPDDAVPTFHMILADGMGGADQGAVIAQTAVSALRAVLDSMAPEDPFERVTDAIVEVNTRVNTAYEERGGTTLIVARAVGGRLWFASVGDSQLYLWRAGRIYEMNQRHEYLTDLYAEALAGRTTVAEALADPQMGALTSFIGGGDLAIDATRRPFPLRPGDTLLACSDGVSDTLGVAALEDCLGAGPDAACAAIVGLIRERDLPDQDNYTALVARIVGDPGTWSGPHPQAHPTDPAGREPASHPTRTEPENTP